MAAPEVPPSYRPTLTYSATWYRVAGERLGQWLGYAREDGAGGWVAQLQAPSWAPPEALPTSQGAIEIASEAVNAVGEYAAGDNSFEPIASPTPRVIASPVDIVGLRWA
ncbi:MAG: hypothetical protein FJ100_13575 [Deltaproteobacteria bacterium]|nr:hypothetical protein [Deltaproteobacteria bacterium]